MSPVLECCPAPAAWRLSDIFSHMHHVSTMLPKIKQVSIEKIHILISQAHVYWRGHCSLRWVWKSSELSLCKKMTSTVHLKLIWVFTQLAFITWTLTVFPLGVSCYISPLFSYSQFSASPPPQPGSGSCAGQHFTVFYLKTLKHDGCLQTRHEPAHQPPGCRTGSQAAHDDALYDLHVTICKCICQY